jgi:hypothetical protein
MPPRASRIHEGLGFSRLLPESARLQKGVKRQALMGEARKAIETLIALLEAEATPQQALKAA